MRRIDKTGLKPEYECYAQRGVHKKTTDSTNPVQGENYVSGDVKAVINVRWLDRKALAGQEITNGDFNADLYKGEIRKRLIIAHHGKCCYCERTISSTPREEGDVEHFRPKSEVQQSETDDPIKPAYYWLAYQWDNLLYACETCNQGYKKIYFPLKNPADRANLDHRSIRREQALLINPAEQDPTEHIYFKDSGDVVALTDEGEYSIKYYGLDRSKLITDRKTALDLLDMLLNEYAISTGKRLSFSLNARKRHHKAFIEEYRKKTKPEVAYSGCIISVFGAAYKKLTEIPQKSIMSRLYHLARERLGNT